MCDVCGCSHDGLRIEGQSSHDHAHAHDGAHHHAHEHSGHDRAGADHHHEAGAGDAVHPHRGAAHHHHHAGHGNGETHHHHEAGSGDSAHAHTGGTLDFGRGPARAHAPGLSQARMVRIEQDIQAKNDAYAARNRARFEASGTLALNLLSSPGSGKTTLLTATLERLAGAFPIAVIEGDQQTTNDAERIRATGAPAIQINTGKGCHLDAHMVGHAADGLALAPASVLFIENVGNLVCPAAFDLGEAHRVVVLSVTEGEDKPLKYPDMFAAADLVLLNKVDLLPHVDFDIALTSEYARRIKPDVEVLLVSARTGEGLNAWLEWLRARRRDLLSRQLEGLEERAAAVREQLAAAR